MNSQKAAKFFISISAPLLTGFIGSIFTFTSINSWYIYLKKPFFTPPNSIFAPVWTALYILMGISLYIIWGTTHSKKKIRQEGIRIFIVQLILNALWSIAFFGFHSLSLSVAVIAVLWILVYVTIKIFSKVSKTAAYLLYPYLLWVTFAMMLNIGIALLNL